MAGKAGAENQNFPMSSLHRRFDHYHSGVLHSTAALNPRFVSSSRPDDFGNELTPELRAQEERHRAQLAAKR